MRTRASIPLRRAPAALLAGLAATTLVLSPVSSQAAQGHAAVVPCPLVTASSGAQPPCCGPPRAEPGATVPCCAGGAQPICCPPNADCAQLLSISATPDPSRAGEPVTISGRAAAGMSGDQATLWQRAGGGRRFSPVQRTRISSSGSYAFRRTAVNTNRSWYVTAGGVRSATISQQVRLRIEESSTGSSCGRGWMSVTLAGAVFPAQPGRRLWMLGREGRGRWRVLARPRLRAGSRFTVSHRWRMPARVEVRLYFPGDRRNAAASSGIATASCS